MFRHLTLIHRKTGTTAQTPFALNPVLQGLPGVVLWETCLRQILLGSAPAVSAFAQDDEDEIFHGEAAYAFLLEVLCGLHSKVLGENEIVGQFKKRFLKSGMPLAYQQEFGRLPQVLLADMKRVRAMYPLNLGNHSYGSFVRRIVNERLSDSPTRYSHSPISLVGTGELAKAILPWIISPQKPVTIFHRSEIGKMSFEKACAKEMKIPVQSLYWSCMSTESPTFSAVGEVMILAAPISAARVLKGLKENAEAGGIFPSLVFDFRGNCAVDPLLIPSEVVDLHDFFRQSKSVDEASAERRKKASLMISELSAARIDSESMQIRTQGWEDLCG
ncbi:MAG: hypothetical protein H7301_01665 [Cryobacterium sp.]|nr:hypothetical protein [Oligoflexia bacterium]